MQIDEYEKLIGLSEARKLAARRIPKSDQDKRIDR